MVVSFVGWAGLSDEERRTVTRHPSIDCYAKVVETGGDYRKNNVISKFIGVGHFLEFINGTGFFLKNGKTNTKSAEKKEINYEEKVN